VPLLRDDLLKPIEGANPSGQNLYYAPVYDKIKEARFEDEDDAPQGAWEHTRKKADVAAVIKLAGEALANQSKDLQLAAWIGEATIKQSGFAGLPEALQLLYDLQQQYWDTCYPELEDGSPEFRSTPQEWFASQCDKILRRLPLTKSGLDWLKYRESRAVGYEEDASGSESKAQERQTAIDEGKVTAEEWDEAFDKTTREFYEGIATNLDTSLGLVGKLDEFCEQKYAMVAPNFGKLRGVLEELKQTLHVLLAKKRPAETVSAATTGGSETEIETTGPAEVAVYQPQPSEDPAISIGRLAAAMRKQDATAVAPYLITRALRWGELRSQGDNPDPNFLVAPPTEVRQEIRRLTTEGNAEGVLDAVERAMMTPCGRAWLDLQRYAWQASESLSYSFVSKAICTETKALLEDFPQLPAWTLNDDTPTANAETKTWIDEHLTSLASSVTAEESVMQIDHEPQVASGGSDGAYETAQQLAKQGRFAEAIEGLARQTSMATSGRQRFTSQVQISQICLSSGHAMLAYPILQDLVAQIERRNLFEWEDSMFLSEPLALFVRCIDQTTKNDDERNRVYGLLCRLGPTIALQMEAPRRR